MEIALVEYVGKDLLREDVLNQHFSYVSLADGGVDRMLGLLEELGSRVLECRVGCVGIVDLTAQSAQHRRQVRLELLDSLAELRDLWTFPVEEKRDETAELLRFGHRASHH